MPWLRVNQTRLFRLSAVPTPVFALDVHRGGIPGQPGAKRIVRSFSSKMASNWHSTEWQREADVRRLDLESLQQKRKCACYDRRHDRSTLARLDKNPRCGRLRETSYNQSSPRIEINYRLQRRLHPATGYPGRIRIRGGELL